MDGCMLREDRAYLNEKKAISAGILKFGCNRSRIPDAAMEFSSGDYPMV
jgi:hypothetical protein